MPKQLPSQAGRKQWTYTCHTMNYVWSTIVVANSVKEARVLGLREARAVMGNHARIHKDEVAPLACPRAIKRPRTNPEGIVTEL